MLPPIGLNIMPPIPEAALQMPIIRPTFVLNQALTRIGKLR